LYFFHYSNPPSNPTPAPTKGLKPKAEPKIAPPAAVVNGLALVLTPPDVTGNPDAIGETKPAYCCNAWNGAKFCCLCNCSNC